MLTLSKRHTVLVVEDSPALKKQATSILEEFCDVLTADSGEMALKVLESDRVDLILLDVVMGGMSGFDLMALLQKDSITKDIPVIFATSIDSEGSEIEGLMLGAVDYITKPYNKVLLQLRVGIHLRLLEQRIQIEKFSLTDALTELDNRRSFDKWFHVEWGRAMRGKVPLSLMILDIDKFKLFNDNYGHQVGDICLKVFARIISGTVKRASDTVFRYGGEEFFILLPNTELQGAITLAERVRKNVASTDVPISKTKTTGVTTSIGVGTIVPTVKDTMSAFYESVDKALYKAKADGRNRVVWVVDFKQ